MKSARLAPALRLAAWLGLLSLAALPTPARGVPAAGVFRSADGRFAIDLGGVWEPIPGAPGGAASAAFGDARGSRSSASGDWPFPGFQLGFQRVGAPAPFANPLFLVRFESGSVGPDALDRLRRRVEQEAPRWVLRPEVDPIRRLFTYAERVSTPGAGDVTRLQATFFGRERVVTFSFSSDARRFEEILPTYRAVIESFRFDDGEAGDPTLRARLVTAALVNGLLLGVGLGLHRWSRRSSTV